jgi:uncharacterized protein
MIFGEINKGIAVSMKSGDKVRLETLRMMKSKILNVNARGDLTDQEVIKILKNYSKALKESIDIMSQHGRTEEMEKIKAESAIVGEFLPEMLSEEATKELVKETIAALGLASKKQIGLVMKEITGKRADVDSAKVKDFALEILQ